MKIATLLFLLGLFKQDTTRTQINHHPFIEITDSTNKIHLYESRPIRDGSYYCFKHEDLEDVKVVKAK